MSHDKKIIQAPDVDFRTKFKMPLPQEQDVIPAALSKHLNEKGFLLTQTDRLFDWARTGSMLCR